MFGTPWSRLRWDIGVVQPPLRLTMACAVCLGPVWDTSSVGMSAQPPADVFETMQAFTRQAENFVPGFVKEISPQERARLAQIEIEWRDEQRYGAQILENYESQLRLKQKSVVRRGRDVTYLQTLIGTLQPLMQNAQRYKVIRIGIVPLEQPDAYSIPGGDILVTTGLIDSAGSEGALVGVLAHELSHLDRGHQLLPLKQSKTMAQGFDWRQLQSMAAIMKPFHPELEQEADNDAFRWMVAAGYDPRELAHLLESWDQQQNSQAPWIDVIPGFVKSHPDAGRRAKSLIEKYSALPNQADLYIGHENLKRRIPRDKQRF
jgi:predicted Zn-dependent protease